MKTRLTIAMALLIGGAVFNGCKKEEPAVTPIPATVYGCMDKTSTNYNPSATIDDGSCKHSYTVEYKAESHVCYDKKFTVSYVKNGITYTHTLTGSDQFSTSFEGKSGDYLSISCSNSGYDGSCQGPPSTEVTISYNGSLLDYDYNTYPYSVSAKGTLP